MQKVFHFHLHHAIRLHLVTFIVICEPHDSEEKKRAKEIARRAKEIPTGFRVICKCGMTHSGIGERDATRNRLVAISHLNCAKQRICRKKFLSLRQATSFVILAASRLRCAPRPMAALHIVNKRRWPIRALHLIRLQFGVLRARPITSRHPYTSAI